MEGRTVGQENRNKISLSAPYLTLTCLLLYHFMLMHTLKNVSVFKYLNWSINTNNECYTNFYSDMKTCLRSKSK